MSAPGVVDENHWFPIRYYTLIKDKILENFSNKHAYSGKIDEVSLENTAGSGLFRAGQAGGPKKVHFFTLFLSHEISSTYRNYLKDP